MRRRGDRLNRVTLSILGVLVLASCALGLLASYKVFGTARAENSPITNNMRAFVDRNHGWFWPSVVGVCIVIAFLSYRWLRLQFRQSSGQAVLDLTTDRAQGSDLLSVAQLTAVVNDDIKSLHRISNAKTTMYVRGKRIDVETVVSLEDLAHVNDFVEELRAGSIARVQKAIGRDDIQVTLRIRFAPLTAASN